MNARVQDERLAPLGWLDGRAKSLVTQRIAALRQGQITLTDASGTQTFGEPGDLRARLVVREPRFYRHSVLGGTLSVAESYLRGDWESNDLVPLIRLFVRNLEAVDRFDGGLSRVVGLGNRLYHWWHANNKRGSRRNIEAHYDLGNEFFQLWLDDTWAYSSGIFPTPKASLREASQEKFDRICRQLDLQPSDHVLEIGSGWGGFAIHAALRYGCRVTTTTISQAQFDLAKQRIAAAGVADRVTLLLADYRDLTGQFDKLVSIEMIEAVGHRFYDTYFRKCSELLKPEGSFVLQAIVMPDRHYQTYIRSVDFIQRYVFPGGCLPSIGALTEASARTTDFRLVRCDDFAWHYAETLRRWRQQFTARLDDVRRLGYSEQFIRLWNYYFCYCEAAFEERFTGVVQMHFDKPLCRRETFLEQTAEASSDPTVLKPCASRTCTARRATSP